MPIIYEPTLIKSSPTTTLSANAGGASAAVEFDFGINEGAKIEKVHLTGFTSVGASGVLEAGLNFRPSAGSPAAAYDMVKDDDVFAMCIGDESFTTSGWVVTLLDFVHDFHMDSIYIVKDMTFQLFEAGGNARSMFYKIYYKRCRFSDAEMGNLLRNY